MDETLTPIYEALATGTVPDFDLSVHGRPLLYAAIDKAGSNDVEDRMGALRVAAHLGPDDRMRLAEAMIRDEDARVRRYAFDLAVEAQSAGLFALKSAVEGSDDELCRGALELIITQSNKASGLHARNWLHHESAVVRGGAAMLLGNISGPALAVQLRRLEANDPHPSVRTLAAQAVRRIMGQEPKGASRNFWEAGPTAIPVTEELPPVEEPPIAATPAAAESSVPPSTAPPTSNALTAPDPAAETPPAPQPELVGDWRDSSPLPSTMPSEARTLIKLLGMVGVADRPAVVETLEAKSAEDVAGALRSWKKGGDSAFGRGVGITIGTLGLKTHAASLRGLLNDSDPAVRAGAAEGVGHVGAPSLIPPLGRLLDDEDADVRLAAVRGLDQLLTRTSRLDMLRDRLTPLTSDSDERVKSAASAALSAIA